MNNQFIVVSLTPMVNVTSSKTESGTMNMRSIVLRELGGQYANSYAVKVFGAKASENYYPGQLVAASLRFRATNNPTTGQTYQDVIAEEIVKINNNYNDEIL